MATLKKKTQAEIERGQKKAQQRFKKMVEQTEREKEEEDERGVQRETLKAWNKNMARVQVGDQVIEGEMIDVQVEFKDDEFPIRVLGKEMTVPTGHREVTINLTIRNPTNEGV